MDRLAGRLVITQRREADTEPLSRRTIALLVANPVAVVVVLAGWTVVGS
ncbi:hypothetical protein [Natrarchaeobius oligotrophus]|nr:hypothetical protein [Natrarchaeobius chitinivorans]